MSKSKYLDLAGLTTYDKKIKEWFKSGVVDITDDSIRALFTAVQPNNEIWYTSSDENVVTPYATDVFGANIVSNTYENGKGVITFDGDITSIGESAFADCSGLTSITIPNRVTTIRREAFSGCSSLNSITYEGTQEQWNTVTKGGDWKYNVPATYVQCSDGQVTL
jgi:hypothetical protein